MLKFCFNAIWPALAYGLAFSVLKIWSICLKPDSSLLSGIKEFQNIIIILYSVLFIDFLKIEILSDKIKCNLILTI